MNDSPLKTLIVDDSMVFRKILSDLLKPMAEIEVVGQAPNGKIALQKIITLKPDLIMLDLDMPEMNGLELLDEMKMQNLSSGVIIISGASTSMCNLAIKALNAGAFEFIAKPAGETMQETRNLLEADLSAAVFAFTHRFRFRRDLSRPDNSLQATPGNHIKTEITPNKSNDSSPAKISLFSADLIVIGISTGGPPALLNIFSEISHSLKTPIIIVQHIPASFSEALAESIREKSGLNVLEVVDEMALQDETIYLAPGGRHLSLCHEKNEGYFFKLSDEAPVNNCRPSIDYLLESVAHNFAGRVAFFIMTGMGIDGLAGARLIKNKKGYVVAQNESSCVVYGMPKAVVEAGLADEILSLKEIRTKIERLSLQKMYKYNSAAGSSENFSEKEVNKNDPEIGES